MDDQSHPTARIAAVAAAVVQLLAASVYLAVMTASGPELDRLGAVAITAVYAAPAGLALAGLRGRAPLLLAATVAAGVLAVFPVSAHSFVLAPAAVVYAIAYARRPASRHPGRATLAILGCPVLLVAAFVVLMAQAHPACYAQLESGERVIDRDPGAARSGSRVISPDAAVVATGCSSDITVWWEAAASLALSATAIAAGLLGVPDDRAEDHRHRTTTA